MLAYCLEYAYAKMCKEWSNFGLQNAKNASCRSYINCFFLWPQRLSLTSWTTLTLALGGLVTSDNPLVTWLGHDTVYVRTKQMIAPYKIMANRLINQPTLYQLVDSTHLNNISQIGSFPQVRVKIKKMKPPPSVRYTPLSNLRPYDQAIWKTMVFLKQASWRTRSRLASYIEKNLQNLTQNDTNLIECKIHTSTLVMFLVHNTNTNIYYMQ